VSSKSATVPSRLIYDTSALRWFAALCSLIALAILSGMTLAPAIKDQQKEYDSAVLQNLLPDYVISENFAPKLLVISPAAEGFRNTDLLGLRHSRLAYRVEAEGMPAVSVLAATTEDGFNGSIDLLVAVNDFGRIQAVLVVKDIKTSVASQRSGQLQGIESQWIKRFATKTMREVRQLSWQEIPPQREYDQFVGASITPNLVAGRIYDSLVFFQSNRIALSSAFANR